MSLCKVIDDAFDQKYLWEFYQNHVFELDIHLQILLIQFLMGTLDLINFWVKLFFLDLELKITKFVDIAC